jgi:glycyl-tRNA synthetase beta chain
MPELIFEIGCEEMPARFVKSAIEQLAELTCTNLLEASLITADKAEWLKSYGTPRRLAVVVKGIAAKQPDTQKQVLGPPLKSAYDDNGNPTKAALGFAASQGVDLSQLQVFPGDKGARVGYLKGSRGREAAEVLAELLPALVQALHFSKAMRWGSQKLRFTRPIHWFLAMLDDKVVNFKLAGIKSGNRTYGHRFLAPQGIALDHADEYMEQLTPELAFVEVDREKRKEMVYAEVCRAALEACGRLIESTREEKELIGGLIDEVTDLIELPVACTGTFDREFLEVPRPVIVTAMREHQRYFPLEDAAGKLLPAFIAVNNTRAKDMSIVVRGHERVLRARLADARFFLKEDSKRPLISRLEDLKNVTYHAKLGTSFEKVKRFTALAGHLSAMVAPELGEKVLRAASLAKCDLVTGMVGEFPSLQGQVGEYYASRDGEDPAVCQAVREHYKPASAYDSVPEGLIGALVGIADRLDSICGLFGIGQYPTGAADQYALRRAAIAIIRIVTEKGLKLSLGAALDHALAGLAPWVGRPAAVEVKAEVLEFFAVRSAGLLAEQGVPTDVAEAVLAAGLDDLLALRGRALALAEMKKLPDFTALAVGLKRVMNILRKEAAQAPDSGPQLELFQVDAERELHAAFAALAGEAQARFDRGEYFAFLQGLSALKGPIDKFFDDVMVMVEDEELRRNRLALLNEIYALFGRLAHFALLQLA